MQVLAQRLFVGARDAIVEEAVGGRVGEAAVLDGLHGVGDRKVCFGGNWGAVEGWRLRCHGGIIISTERDFLINLWRCNARCRMGSCRFVSREIGDVMVALKRFEDSH